jgi:hypothetical protein
VFESKKTPRNQPKRITVTPITFALRADRETRTVSQLVRLLLRHVLQHAAQMTPL